MPAGRPWEYPGWDAMSQAMQQNPTQAAAAGFTQQQGQNSPVTGTVPQTPMARQGNMTQAGVAQQGAANSRGIGGNTNPATFGAQNQNYLAGSGQWYGQGNELGASIMASDPVAFWGGYAEDVMGLPPGSDAAAFYGDKYNTNALGSVMYGRNFVGDEAQLAGQTAIANNLAQPGAQFFDPGSLIQSTLQALTSSNPEQLAKQNPQLAAIIQGSVGNPGQQVSLLINFLGDVLSSSMPPDMLNAFLGQLNSLGQNYFSQIRRSPTLGNIPTFANFLMQSLGPRLGL